jgi:hypothetical protein
MHYFENKNDAIIFETISIYKDGDNIEMLDTIDSIIIFFFYGIKTDNIARYNNFVKIINKSKVERLINIFNIIEQTNIADFLGQQEASPDLNDVYWTLYFATGNAKYLDNLLKVVMEYYNETRNINYYMAARSAMWSISSNMQAFVQVRDYVTKSNILNTEIKEYIINSDPDKIQTDTIEFINKRR